MLSIAGNQLTISDGNSVDLPAGFDGDYNSLTNRPTIPIVPTSLSQFDNDENFVDNTACSDVSFCELLNMVRTLQQQMDSVSAILSQLEHPTGEDCIPTSSTQNINISTDQLPYTFGDTTFLAGTETGTYFLRRTNAGGCDSTITINLIVTSVGEFTCGTSTVSDMDGNTYNTVLIGEQCWMKENLRTTKRPDETSITSGIWTPGSNSVDIYGRLYSWTTVMNGASSSNAVPSGVQGICPTGWHLPSDAEWLQMERIVGMSISAANNVGWRGDIAARLSGNTGWTSSNTVNAAGNTSAANRNSTDFSALPASNYANSYDNFGNSTNFWSTSQYDGTNAWNRGLSYDNAGVSRYAGNKSYGYSVRCVRD